MKQKLITVKQIETIEKLAEPIFGNIKSSGFKSFSRWLVENFGYFDHLNTSSATASKIIQKLKETRGSNSSAKPSVPAGFWDGVVRVMAKVYLKGFYEGRVAKESAPSLDELERVIKEEFLSSKSA